MSDDNYPAWIYPPDGGPGIIINSPDGMRDGWLTQPVGPMAAGGERVIGQPVEHVTPATPTADEDVPPSRKSKKA